MSADRVRAARSGRDRATVEPAAASRYWTAWLCVGSIVFAGAMLTGCGGGDAATPTLAVVASSVSAEQPAQGELAAPATTEHGHFGAGSVSTVALDEIRVSTTTGPSKAAPGISRLNGGDLAVAWNAYRPGDGSANGIYVQRYDTFGRILGSLTHVAGPSNPMEDPQVTGLADGGFAVAWPSGVLSTRAYDSLSRPRGEAVQVNAEETQWAGGRAAIAPLSHGGYVVAWRGRPFSQDSSADEAIYMRRFDAGGSPLGEEMRASTSTLGQMDSPSLAGLPDGGYVVVWASSTANWSSTNFYARRFDSAGTALGEETLVSAVTYGYAAQVAALADGGWAIAWTGSRGSGTPGISMRRYDADGLPAGAEVTVDSGTWHAPLIAALSDGGLVVAWVVYETTDYYYGGVRYDYAVGDLHARRYDHTGVPLGDPLVFATATNERVPALIGLADGGFMLAWRANTDPRDVGEIYVRSFKDALVGADGSDWLQADDRVHVLLGAGGKDRLLGSAANDWLDGGGGADFMAGGPGDDLYIVDSDKDIVRERPGEGHDTVKSSISYVLPHDVEDLILTDPEAIDGYGNEEDNVIVGNAASNRLGGGPGRDTLDGGGGHDTFVFDSKLGAGNVDVVRNFIAAEDAIELDARIFKALPRGVLSATALAIGGAATDGSHRILFDPATKALMYDPDGSGSAAAVRFAVLEGLVGDLSAANFVVR